MATPAETVIKKRPHTYTPEERATLSQSVTDILDQQDELELEKKASVAAFKSREAELDNKLKSTRNNLKQGFEPREYTCSIIRDQDTKMVSYVDVVSGETIDTKRFSNEDWDIVLGPPSRRQLDMFGDELPAGTVAPQTPRELYPDFDENGNVVAGPRTDRYNLTYPDSVHQHLSEYIDFKPALPSTGLPQADAELQVYYNDTVRALAFYDRAQLEEALGLFEADTTPEGREIDENHKLVRAEIVRYIVATLDVLDKNPDDEPAAPQPEGDAEPAEDDGPEGTADEDQDDADEDEPQEDAEGGDEAPDEPKKPKKPRTPKRPAKRMPASVK